MSEPTPNGDDGRDESGRFTQGNPGGPGNPFARRVARLRSTLLDVVGETGLTEIVERLVKAAQKGDVAAAKLVLSYTLGKPVKSMDPDALDLHERELRLGMGLGKEEPIFDEAAMERIDRMVEAIGDSPAVP